jgi:hypothetical protein
MFRFRFRFGLQKNKNDCDNFTTTIFRIKIHLCKWDDLSNRCVPIDRPPYGATATGTASSFVSLEAGVGVGREHWGAKRKRITT